MKTLNKEQIKFVSGGSFRDLFIDCSCSGIQHPERLIPRNQTDLQLAGENTRSLVRDEIWFLNEKDVRKCANKCCNELSADQERTIFISNYFGGKLETQCSYAVYV